MSDHDAVLQANRAFYDAFESLDLERMEGVWLQSPHITCIHPGWRRLSGWGPVMHSWEKIFEATFEMKFELVDVEVMLHGELAIVVNQENLTQRTAEGSSRSRVLATNIYERIGERWYLALHHASPVMQPDEDEPPIQ